MAAIVPPLHAALNLQPSSLSLSPAGTIPSFYREIYDVVCPGSCTKVPKEAWLRCLRTSSLSATVLEQVKIPRRCAKQATLCSA